MGIFKGIGGREKRRYSMGGYLRYWVRDREGITFYLFLLKVCVC